jgi:hypothetical protein
MNYKLSYKIKETYNAKGYNVEMSNSNSSDYLRITNPADKYGFKYVVRISNHDAMTGRSECADMQLITTEMFSGEFAGMFESNYGYDGSDADDCGNYEYQTEAEREAVVLQVILAKLNEKIDF